MRVALAVVVLASCWSTAKAPPSLSSSEPARVTTDGGVVLTQPMAGPFTSLTAFCATRPKADGAACFVGGRETGTPKPASVLDVVVMHVTTDAPIEGCAIALQTKAGWFVTPVSKDPCHEAGYIDLVNFRFVDEGGAAFAVHVDNDWHTNNHDDHASFTVSTVCTVAASGVPACMPLFVSKCETRAPASDCYQSGYEATWKVTGSSITFDSNRRSTDPHVRHGTHRLF